eukprot:3288161-Amphidinium_carterae.1
MTSPNVSSLSPKHNDGGDYEVSEDEDAGSDDSADDDFLALRQTVKQSSLQMIGSTPSSSSTAPPRPALSKPLHSKQRQAQSKPRPLPPDAPRTTQTFQRRLPQQKFVKLELVASSEEDDDEASGSDTKSDLGDLNAGLPDEEEEHLH